MASLENAGKQRSALFDLTLSPEDAHHVPPLRKTSDPMTKTKRRMFSTPLLRRSATASGAAAASAASKIKSMTKLPTALKRAGHSHAENKQDSQEKKSAGRPPTISSTVSTNDKPEPKQKQKKFGIQSLMRRTSSKDAKDTASPRPNPLDSPQRSDSDHTTEESDADVVEDTAKSSGSRFVPRMPAMLKRVVSTGHSSQSSAAPVKAKKSPDTSANSTPRGDSDEPEEDTRRSLLMMMQVPDSLRRSQLPLMAVTESW